MSDLTDALAESDKWFERGITLMVDKRHPFVAAARRVAEAPEVEWCDIHNGKFRFEDRCDGADALDLDGCRMVRKLLVDPPKENT